MDLSIGDEPFVAHRSPEEWDLVHEEINEKPAEVDKAISDFRSWVKSQKHFTIRTDDFFLLSVSRMAKWDMIKARSIIEKFCMYQCVPDTRGWMLHSQAEVSDRVQQFYDTGFVIVLPKRNSSDGCRITVSRYRQLDLELFSVNEAMKCLDWICKVRALDFSTTANRAINISDFSGIKLSTIKYLTLAFMKRFSNYMHEGMPYRVHAEHLLNLPLVVKGMGQVYKKLFLSSKIRNRIFTYGADTSGLLKHFDRSCLPDEYGGTAGTLAQLTAQHRQHLDANLAELDKFSTMSYDPTLKAHVLDEQQGAEGTFRKLRVD